jgi:uncharacterized cupin superfamily protein
MSEEVVKGEGYSVASDLDAIGEGYGFRKLRRALDVEAFGVNVIVMPPGYSSGAHFHERQEELYFVHRGRVAIEFGDGTTHELGEGGAARVAAPTTRKVTNLSDSEDAVYLVVGGEGGYVGRDGKLAEGEESRFGESGPPSPS